MSTVSKYTSSSKTSASSKASIPEQLVALPSFACNLSSLPQAKSIDHLALHAAQRPESEAKLRKALSQNGAHPNGMLARLPPNAAPQFSANNSSPPLMMRKTQTKKLAV